MAITLVSMFEKRSSNFGDTDGVSITRLESLKVKDLEGAMVN